MTEYERKSEPMVKADLAHFVDEYGRDYYSLSTGRPVCGRLKKKHNRLIENECCLAPPMASGACRVHGGKAGGPLKHGRYSRALKTWRPAFERALNDKDLLDTRRDLALMDVTIEKLLERVEELDTPGWRAEVSETFNHLQAAIRSKRKGDVGGLINRLDDLIEKGAAIDQVAQDLMGYLDKRSARASKMMELDLRREEKITVTEVAGIFGSWLKILEGDLDSSTYLSVVEKLRRSSESQHLPGVAEGDKEAE